MTAKFCLLDFFSERWALLVLLISGRIAVRTEVSFTSTIKSLSPEESANRYSLLKRDIFGAGEY